MWKANSVAVGGFGHYGVAVVGFAYSVSWCRAWIISENGAITVQRVKGCLQPTTLQRVI